MYTVQCMRRKITSLNDNITGPFWFVLLKIAAFWFVANVGYYLVLPVLGIDLSYNTAPIAIAIYYFVWSFFSIIYFWDIFSKWLPVDSRIWVYVVSSITFAGVSTTVLYIFSVMPILIGPSLAPYSDILFATPWYFLPKAADVLTQQMLITVLILKFSYAYRSYYKTLIAYAVSFAGTHLLLYSLVNAPTPYATFMTFGAIVSTAFFPYLILRVRNGFVYTYMIHFSFYLVFAMTLHTWPPPGYAFFM